MAKQFRLSILATALLLSACTFYKQPTSTSTPDPNPAPIKSPAPIKTTQDNQEPTQQGAVSNPPTAKPSDPVNKAPKQTPEAVPKATETKIVTSPSNTVTPTQKDSPETIEEPEAKKTVSEKTDQKEPETHPVKIPKGLLKGNIKVIGKRGKEHRPNNVIVTLRPLKAQSNAYKSGRTHDVNMNNKTYMPVVQTINKGDILRFNNNDNIKHNVFSSSGDNTFDLGTFEGGGVRAVTMEHTGVVKVYCNIHPEMATFVMVTDFPYEAISDREGSFLIKDVPAGDYQLTLWHIRGELKKTITILEGENTANNLTIDASSYKRVAHKNKYGKDYKKKPALFEDEFY